MHQLPLTAFKPGSRAPHGLFHESGLMLVPPNADITERHLAGLRSAGIDSVYRPDSLDDIASFAFERRHIRVYLRELEGEKTLPFDLFDAAEARLASAGTPVDLRALRKLEACAKSGLFRTRTRLESRIEQAERFLHRFPLPEQKPLTDSTIMGLDRTRHDREAEVVAAVKRVSPGIVLIAEDSPNVRRILVQFIQGAGFETEEAADGKRALDMALSGRFCLVLLDIMMPKMDGFAVLRRIKTTPGRTPPKVIMCTAKNTREDVLTALEAGADDYAVKPFTRKIIIEKVARVFAADLLLDERRRAPRKRAPAMMTWFGFDGDGEPLEVHAPVRDLSTAGLSFESPANSGRAPVRAHGTTMRMILDLGRGTLVELSGRMARLEPKGTIEIAGVEFDPPSAEAAKALEDFLKA